MARWVLHEDVLDQVDTKAILREKAEEIAEDARRLAPSRTGRLRESIRVESVTDTTAVIVADAKNPKSSEGKQSYAGHVERGTSDTKAQPFMAPAGLRYRP